MAGTALDDYLAAWIVHGDGKAETADAMVAAASEDVRYSDINLAAPFLGHDGIRRACAAASQLFPGLRVTIGAKVVDGRAWAVEWEMTATHGPSGKPFTCKGASMGTVGADGKVTSHTDYWNPAHAEAQIGGSLIPASPSSP